MQRFASLRVTAAAVMLVVILSGVIEGGGSEHTQEPSAFTWPAVSSEENNSGVGNIFNKLPAIFIKILQYFIALFFSGMKGSSGLHNLFGN
ncbi:hypothetical protein R5R35_005617 [Gryllus longicercus]|uniref:Accessory gland protein n=1 Tax=Gryllus longicercus TaxID=2509291 RepID=A0AAN9Z7R7_9ORTH